MGSTVKGVAIISGTNNNIKGSLHFIQDSNGVTHVKGRISGLTPGLHGFHIHALGDTTNGCISTGPHFNPMKKDHGAPNDAERHAGDLGNIVAGSDGVAEVSISDTKIPLSGQHSILGRAVVVHADPDDLGRVDPIEVKMNGRSSHALTAICSKQALTCRMVVFSACFNPDERNPCSEGIFTSPASVFI